MTVAIATPAAATMPANPSLSLAGALIATATECFKAPADSQYADALLKVAFTYLRDGIAKEFDPATLNGCADVVDACRYLSAAVRRQVSMALRDVARGALPPIVALELVNAAAESHANRMLMSMVCAVGSDGLGDIAAAVEGLIPTQESSHDA